MIFELKPPVIALTIIAALTAQITVASPLYRYARYDDSHHYGIIDDNVLDVVTTLRRADFRGHKLIENRLTNLIERMDIRPDIKEMLKFSITPDFVSNVESVIENEKEVSIRLFIHALKQLMTGKEFQAENWIKTHAEVMRDLNIYEIGKYFEENVLGTAPSPNLGAYHTYNELLNELTQLEEAFPSLMDLVSIGRSWQNRDIWLARITNENISVEKPAVLFVGEHHAREAITVEVCLRFIRYLLENYGTDPIVTGAIDKEIILIVPMLNPDGLETINANPYKDWKRKNCRQDDDADGRVNEDPPNDPYPPGKGIDDDGDGLIDEDPPLDEHSHWGGR